MKVFGCFLLVLVFYPFSLLSANAEFVECPVYAIALCGDEEVCQAATKISNDRYVNWVDTVHDKWYVREAMSRGLSCNVGSIEPQECLVDSINICSDEVLCKQLNSNEQKKRTVRPIKPHVIAAYKEELIRRGASCRLPQPILPVDSGQITSSGAPRGIEEEIDTKTSGLIANVGYALLLYLLALAWLNLWRYKRIFYNDAVAEPRRKKLKQAEELKLKQAEELKLKQAEELKLKQAEELKLKQAEELKLEQAQELLTWLQHPPKLKQAEVNSARFPKKIPLFFDED